MVKKRYSTVQMDIFFLKVNDVLNASGVEGNDFNGLDETWEGLS